MSQQKDVLFLIFDLINQALGSGYRIDRAINAGEL